MNLYRSSKTELIRSLIVFFKELGSCSLPNNKENSQFGCLAVFAARYDFRTQLTQSNSGRPPYLGIARVRKPSSLIHRKGRYVLLSDVDAVEGWL
ncbi:hypothetical protein Lepto7375DRAFT_5255 [Leptolyngbya sp. PCC 7375]|nr:hypothetical protein Lepto7375DRAFT_5255 [Leptolyngbya sp. PCC 7375]